ncbi:MAG: phosphoribosylformylglycinamidine synthase subunit PurQ [Dehalococcoidia bacterium]|jgi:phosphoribosylformylglycinamidine synthase|nr:phosphoribosylformylglycinamidine synthase subunit PurQ [Dehalococcoidia bacterium]MDW8009648.1 phosphoribosylformylglycinamidine synthase subunit PurQ [Chloroflexota bacterium]
MRFAVVVFPGTWSDYDCHDVLTRILGQQADLVWHRQSDLTGYDCVVLPGGFSYGDYLRPGAIARFSPVMRAVAEHARRGRPVIGICNGFQVLCEAHLLPGALLRNEHLQYRCQWVNIRVEREGTPFTAACRRGQVLSMPISHGDGRYYADPETLAMLEAEGRVLFRYCTPTGETTAEANPNGSLGNIAGILNEEGNVLGMMPHPERACEALLGGEDGLAIWRSLLLWASG